MSTKSFYFRTRVVLTSSVFRLLSSFGTLIISSFVVRWFSTGLWGEIVYYLLLLDLGFVAINWGHSFYLSRQFSENPQLISNNFQKAFVSRSYILILFVVVIFLLPVSIHIKVTLAACSLARFIYQAFDPLIQYHRKFLPGLILELAGIVAIVLPLIFLRSDVSLLTVLMLYAISFTFRAVITLIMFRSHIAGSRFPVDASTFLRPALPFLVLTLTAMLQQRMDLYVAALYLKTDKLAIYQVFLSLLLLSHVAASLLLSPFARNMFRLSHERLRKVERQFMFAGIFFSAISIVVIFIILKFVFEFHLSWMMYVCGYVYVLLYYFYQVRNYQFMKAHRQKEVALFSLVGCGLSLVLSFVLIPYYGMEGALIAGLSTQVVNVLLHLRVRFIDDAQGSIRTPSTLA
jgi:O-antigen/teichoic acid export membrane protein